MKKIATFILLLTLVEFSFAKKVKFSVNMTGQVVHASGVHVMGDFQQLAGLGADYSPDSALMIKDIVDTNMYNLVVDIPAFAKYEYKYINGDGIYGVEVVPVMAQVGYGGVDNRWIYIDSLTNDTTLLPPVVFNYSSPTGLTMMRYVVDMTLQTASPNGVHIAGDFQGWNPATSRLYSFGSSAYEIIVYGTSGNSYQYKFYNGNVLADSEIVPAACAMNSNRAMQLSMDTIASKVCFATCTTCYPTAISENDYQNNASIYPNPMIDFTSVEFSDPSRLHHVYITDVSGRNICRYQNIKEGKFIIERNQLIAGIYIISILNEIGEKTTHKLVIE